MVLDRGPWCWMRYPSRLSPSCLTSVEDKTMMSPGIGHERLLLALLLLLKQAWELREYKTSLPLSSSSSHMAVCLVNLPPAT